MSEKDSNSPFLDTDDVDLNSRELTRQVILQRQSSTTGNEDGGISVRYKGIELVETERSAQISWIGSFLNWLVLRFSSSKETSNTPPIPH